MRILGLDVGSRRIGIAISDPLGLTAQRFMVMERQGSARDLQTLRTIVERHGVNRIVVGLPLMMSGAHGTQARRILGFAALLRRQLDLPVDLIDERLTTVQGTRMLQETRTRPHQRKIMIDQVAAQLILQQFLDRHRQTSP